MSGEVVGINALFLKGGESLNFAIPINDAQRLLSEKVAELHDLPNETGPVKSETRHEPIKSAAHFTASHERRIRSPCNGPSSAF
jgi:S1-C subfamily serine protease